ncbi:MAG: tRNA-dihydrouridine synthase family protein [Eubacteriales bacterium]|nr:tRNA-dihydrouridine synthase family protein [Eubacteriales bacterium]
MIFSFAPLEGITLFSFRNVHHEFFPGIDKYYTPFLVANQTKKFKSKEKRELFPENNEGLCVVPQILTNKADEFLWALKTISDYGYSEINFNLGCPSPTVVTRRKGAGMLQDPYHLDRFLEEVFTSVDKDPDLKDLKITIKTRSGFWEQEEAKELLRIYNRYPIHELILHPRVQKDGYSNHPDWDTFGMFLSDCRHPLCYNGDINTVEDYEELIRRFPSLERVMIGRGLVRNPSLVQEIQGGERYSQQLLWKYQKAMFDAYLLAIDRESDVVHKMKEIWTFQKDLLPNHERAIKNIRKSKTRSQYEEAIRPMFTEL